MIAGLGIGALANGFAIQDIFENFLVGVPIMLREKMRIGEAIKTGLDAADIDIPFPIQTNCFPEALRIEQVATEKAAD